MPKFDYEIPVDAGPEKLGAILGRMVEVAWRRRKLPAAECFATWPSGSGMAQLRVLLARHSRPSERVAFPPLINLGASWRAIANEEEAGALALPLLGAVALIARPEEGVSSEVHYWQGAWFTRVILFVPNEEFVDV